MKTQLLTLCLLTLFFSSCKKGDTGPQGPAGSVNVTTANYTTTSASWTSGSKFWYTQLDVSALSGTIQSTAAVEVFFSADNGTSWNAVPYTAVSSTNYFMNFVVQSGSIEVQWTYNGIGNGSDPSTFFGTTLKFRVVVIPAGARKAYLNSHLLTQVPRKTDETN